MKFERFDVAKLTQLPTRATKNSAGYDFYLPEDTTFPAHSVTRVYTNTCIKNNGLQSVDYVLMLYMRSSVGIKKHLMLANGTGVVDKDYDGFEIQLFIYNYGDTDIVMNAGDRIVQGVFMPYLITEDDDVIAERQGGFGSTGQ